MIHILMMENCPLRMRRGAPRLGRACQQEVDLTYSSNYNVRSIDGWDGGGYAQYRGVKEGEF
tara:strand:- start:292 stop:477 length:186 start_codon:yes stop_codon:yes gene_type:complete